MSEQIWFLISWAKLETGETKSAMQIQKVICGKKSMEVPKMHEIGGLWFTQKEVPQYIIEGEIS